MVFFLPYIYMNQSWVYMCPTILNPPPTSHPTPALWFAQGHQLWVPCFIHQTCTGHESCIWSSILHLVIHIFQCYTLILSHLHHLPQSPKVCVIHLCLFAVFHIGSSIHLSKFLIYKFIYCIGVSLSGLLHSV